VIVHPVMTRCWRRPSAGIDHHLGQLGLASEESETRTLRRHRPVGSESEGERQGDCPVLGGLGDPPGRLHREARDVVVEVGDLDRDVRE